MFSKRSIQLASCRNEPGHGCTGFLTFLYCTKTIRRRYETQSASNFLQNATHPKDTKAARDGVADHQPQNKLGPSQPRGEGQGRRESAQRSKEHGIGRGKSQVSSRGDNVPNNHLSSGRRSTLPSRNNQSRHATGMTSFVPFDRGHQSPEGALRNSTITPREEKVFDTLLKLTSETTARYDGSSPSEEGIEVLQLPDALRAIAKRQEAAQRSAEPQDPTAFDEAVKKDLDAVKAAYNAARSDIELWDVFQDCVLRRVIQLKLDNAQSPRQQSAMNRYANASARGATHGGRRALKAKAPAEPLSEDPDVIKKGLSAQVDFFVQFARSKFPSSPVCLNALPALRRLGPSAMTLGATTRLFNVHISALYRRYKDLQAVIDVLKQMHRDVFAFDDFTAIVLLRIVRDVQGALDGRAGEARRAFWDTDRSRGLLTQIRYWRRRVEDQRQEEALRKTREQEELEKAEAAWNAEGLVVDEMEPPKAVEALV